MYKSYFSLKIDIDSFLYIFAPTLFANFSVVIAILLTEGNSETERHLKLRADEHVGTSPLTGKRINNNKISTVKNHCLSNHCRVRCVPLMILPFSVMSHASLKV